MNEDRSTTYCANFSLTAYVVSKQVDIYKFSLKILYSSGSISSDLLRRPDFRSARSNGENETARAYLFKMQQLHLLTPPEGLRFASYTLCPATF